MDKDTQLPAELQDEIWEKAKAYARMHGRKQIGFYSLNWEAGATEYALKLHQAQQENDKAKLLLGEIINAYARALPIWDIINEIKTFLDGK